MIEIPDVNGAAIGVFGLGVTGLATCEALIASGAEIYSWDENTEARKKTRNTEYLSEHPKKWPWERLAAVVVSPGVPLTHPKPHAIVRKARAENIPVIGDTELFARAINAISEKERPRIVAITGTNGKSTTTALIGHILKSVGETVHVGGNIGEPVLSLPAPAKHATYVLELSSFQLDLTYSLRANAAVFLNLSPDHIERHGTVGGYVAAKRRIFRNQTKEDMAVIGVDDDTSEAVCTQMIARDVAPVAPISAQSTLGRGVYALDGNLFYNLDGKTTSAGSLDGAHALRGAHNHQNAAAALAVCHALGVAPAIAVSAMERFEGLAHRMETVGVVGKTRFVNDSKATNAGAAAKALGAYEDIFWIAGGRAKEEGAAPLRDHMGAVRRAYLIGEAATSFEETLRGAVHCVLCDSLEDAVSAARADAQASDAPEPVVLLSPACASYDQFASFVARGEAFRSCVSAQTDTTAGGDAPLRNGGEAA
ncbi:MAG: UDP-N-acetylmuramoyl-L-alanine--D-glutamate ligase [Pseudomonadota bacterium]